MSWKCDVFMLMRDLRLLVARTTRSGYLALCLERGAYCLYVVGPRPLYHTT